MSCPRGRGLVSKRLRSCVKEAVNFFLKFREENKKNGIEGKFTNK